MKSWLIALALSLGPTVTHGFGRLGYALVLPAMRSDLSWSYTQAGFMNSAYAVGYLVGAYATFRVIHGVSLRHCFLGGIAANALALFISGVTSDYYILAFARALAGVSAAPCFIAGGALAAALFLNQPRKNALAIAIYFAGAGIGLTVSGALLPPVLDELGAKAWPLAWGILAIGSAVCLGPAIWASLNMEAAKSPSAERVSVPWRVMIPSLAGYFLYASSFIVYMTFIVAWMLDHQVTTSVVVAMWSTLGVSVMLSPFVWRRILASGRGIGPLALSIAGTAAGSFLPVMTTSISGLMISAFVFGICFFIPPAAVTSFVKNNFAKTHWGAAIALYTTLFAAGQIIGPIGAGWISEMSNSLAWGLATGTAVLGCASIVAGFQRQLEPKA